VGEPRGALPEKGEAMRVADKWTIEFTLFDLEEFAREAGEIERHAASHARSFGNPAGLYPEAIFPTTAKLFKSVKYMHTQLLRGKR